MPASGEWALPFARDEFGPGGTATAHTIDEGVAVDDLVAFSAAVTLLAMRWCGTGE